MKKLINLIFLLLILCKITVAQQATTEFPKLTGPYLGQKPPGMEPELFAPGIVSTGNHEHSSPVFTPDLKEMYWGTIIRENGKTIARTVYYMKLVNGIWTKPERPSFTKEFTTCENPFISPDGKRLFFSVSKTLSPLNFELYYVNRIKDEWSEPIKMEKPLNASGSQQWQLTISKGGTIYFTGYNENSRSKCGVYSSKLENGKYQEPVLMNDLATDFSPYIAPDESYIIFNSWREGQFGNGDLYISFRNENGLWKSAINMGDKINTENEERFPNVSPDGKYLFFNRSQEIQDAEPNGPGNGLGDVYWVSAKIIEELKPKEQK